MAFPAAVKRFFKRYATASDDVVTNAMPPSTGRKITTQRSTKRSGALYGLASLITMSALTGCGAAPDLTGNWTADDGTQTKVINEAGACRGMFYSNGKPLDIGGGMSCSLSEKKNSNGRYSLIVSQPPNEASYEIEFDGNDAATVYDGSGTRIYSMKRL